jgi:hypothetical protein
LVGLFFLAFYPKEFFSFFIVKYLFQDFVEMASQQPTKEQQKIFAGFKKLREEQQQLVGDIQRNSAEIRETQ